MTLRIEEPGLLTTVQDLGRAGYQSSGVSASGAMDAFALRAANLLVGNPEGAAGLEITLAGPRIHFQESALVALAGADLGAEADGKPLPPWLPARVPAGATLSFHAARSGCRGYLAVAGGVDVPVVLGSRSTYLAAAIGGMDGRALRSGDLLPVGEPPELALRIAAALARRGEGVVAATIGIGPTLRPRYSDRPAVRLLPGEHAPLLTPESRRRLHAAEFQLSPRSDRNGYRLEGVRVELSSPLEILSEAVAFGTLQLPPDGTPILLMADRQTTGGYPRIGEVASVDLPLLAQLRPGDRVAFRPTTLGEAHALYLARERQIGRARQALAFAYRSA